MCLFSPLKAAKCAAPMRLLLLVFLQLNFFSRTENCSTSPFQSFFTVLYVQGVDLPHGGRRKGHSNRKEAATGNVYVNLLSKLYAFLARRTDAGFNAVVHKRLIMSRTNRPPMGLARVQRYMKGSESKIAVVVGSVTDDIRLDGADFPALKIAALRFTEGARARIVKAGGECLTFDQLAMLRPTGKDTVLLRGRRNARTATRYFGTPGAKDSTTRPRIESSGRKVRSIRPPGLRLLVGAAFAVDSVRDSCLRFICQLRAFERLSGSRGVELSRELNQRSHEIVLHDRQFHGRCYSCKRVARVAVACGQATTCGAVS